MADPITNHSTYLAFFQEIAQKHVDIAHSSEKKAFVRVSLNRDPLLTSKHQINEFLVNEKVNLKPPFMILASYHARFSNSPPGDPKKTFMGTYAILDQPDRKDDFDSENAIIDKCEVIGEQILGYLLNYYLENPQYGEMVSYPFESEALSGLGHNNYAGRLFHFEINWHEYNILMYNPEKFN